MMFERLACALIRRLSRRFALPADDLLRDAVYRRLWTSILISSFGGQVTMLALPLTAAVLLHAHAVTTMRWPSSVWPRTAWRSAATTPTRAASAWRSAAVSSSRACCANMRLTWRVGRATRACARVRRDA